MKFLVSGTTGFIGGHLIERLGAEGHQVHALVRPSATIDTISEAGATPYVFDGDITALISFMQQEEFDGVIHLASLFLAKHTPPDIQGLISSNVLLSTSLLEASVAAGIPWFINTGTFWQHAENKPYSPVNLYAATKQAFEDIAQYYLAASPINFVTIQLSDTFGPGDTRPKVFNLWMKAAKSGEEMNMSPGEQLMDISYIDNVIDAYICLIKELGGAGASALRGKQFAVSSGEAVPLKDLATLFEKATGTTLPIAWGAMPYRPREVMVPWNKGEPVPGWKPAISVEEGIKRTFNA